VLSVLCSPIRNLADTVVWYLFSVHPFGTLLTLSCAIWTLFTHSEPCWHYRVICVLCTPIRNLADTVVCYLFSVHSFGTLLTLSCDIWTLFTHLLSSIFFLASYKLQIKVGKMELHKIFLLKCQVIFMVVWFENPSTINRLTLPYCCSCPKPGSGFPSSYVVIFFMFCMFSEWRWDEPVQFVDPCGIDDHQLPFNKIYCPWKGPLFWGNIVSIICIVKFFVKLLTI
jgi:hypothetical protein